jgi:hypothetical protein
MKTTLYFHAEKCGMRNEFKEAHFGARGREPMWEAIDEASKIGHEVEIAGDWDLDTGKFMATHLMGTKLESPVEI